MRRILFILIALAGCSIPDQQQLQRAQYLSDAINAALTTTQLATPVGPVTPGVYKISMTAAGVWKQGGSWCHFAATPGVPTVTPTGTTGATTYGYKLVVVMPDKTTLTGRSAVGAEGTTTTGNATLTGVNFNALSWAAVTGAESYDIYRTTGGATQGKIGNATGLAFNDTGLAGDASTAPTTSTSVGMPLTADTTLTYGNIWVDGDGDSQYFNARVTSGTGTFSLIAVTDLDR